MKCNLCPLLAEPGDKDTPPLCRECRNLLAEEESCRNAFVGFMQLYLTSRGHPNPRLAAQELNERLKKKYHEKHG